jgi:hypothetical protein
LNIVRSWLGHAEDRLSDDDPGPWAYTIVYLHLQCAAPPESLDRALSALERARYFLEAASFRVLQIRKTSAEGSWHAFRSGASISSLT